MLSLIIGMYPSHTVTPTSQPMCYEPATCKLQGFSGAAISEDGMYDPTQGQLPGDHTIAG